MFVFQQLKAPLRKSLEESKELLLSNNRKYFETLRAIDPPCVPFFGKFRRIIFNRLGCEALNWDFPQFACCKCICYSCGQPDCFTETQTQASPSLPKLFAKFFYKKRNNFSFMCMLVDKLGQCYLLIASVCVLLVVFSTHSAYSIPTWCAHVH